MRRSWSLIFLLVLRFAVFAGESAAARWSLAPLEKPPVPRGPGGSELDCFIRARLSAAGLTTSPPADKRTLVRRLFYDVTGLPPTPDEVERFANERSPDAYERLVEQLLSSPRYGEHWARHWLDVVRFAETHGFEMNQPRPNAWPYRDYIIRAFNEDKPYNHFVLEQIAGDIFGVDEGTGFLVAGPWDQVKSPDPVLTANQRADELHDIVSTTCSTFLGLTVGCARCHDHKFDPIPQKDYYAIKAVFQGVQHGERKRGGPIAARAEAEIDWLKSDLRTLERSIEELQPLANPGASEPRRMPVNAARNVERIPPTLARNLRFTIRKTSGAEPCLDELEVFTADGQNVALASAGTKARASSVYPNSELHRLEHINDGRYGNSRSWISNEQGKGWVELEFPQPVTVTRIIWGRDREENFTDRVATEYIIELRSPADEWSVVASSADRFSNGSMPPTNSPAAPLLARRSKVQQHIRELEQSTTFYGGVFQKTPEPTPRLNRGDPMQPREPVEPGALSALAVEFQCGAPHPKLTEDQRRRLAFARWIVDPRNPLTARVIVNRLWQYHFGQGLVTTPSDFGANGAPPSDPELLDWLAAELIEHQWSIKHIQRLILNSDTFRQSSASRRDGLQLDAGSRLLWRFPPRRLEAESIRDSILLVSGALDPHSGGPGFSFFEPNDNYVRVYNPRTLWPTATFRRMVYGMVVRQRPDSVFGVFDCPDAGQIAPKRTTSTTPLQALNLLNSSFITTQAELFAKRLEIEAGAQPSHRVALAFRLALQREPTPDELAKAVELASADGLPIFCRALLNANEFVYLF